MMQPQSRLNFGPSLLVGITIDHDISPCKELFAPLPGKSLSNTYILKRPGKYICRYTLNLAPLRSTRIH